jgi:coenzyme F420-0:L-glutamate ligase / coenzyme F420-1:gamma-L-glutamate ligase
MAASGGAVSEPHSDDLVLMPLRGIPMIKAGDDLAAIILAALRSSDRSLQPGDVLVLAQKIVSKAEGRTVDLRTVTPSARAAILAKAAEMDARIVELILAESVDILRHRPGALIVAHRLGMVLANAGVDRSNAGAQDHALLLPLDPDRSCADIRRKLKDATGIDAGVIMVAGIGRAWRNGTVGTAIGVSGLPGLVELRGRTDPCGRVLETAQVALADELAAAASLVMGRAGEDCPVVLARGLGFERRDGSAAELVRAREKDLLR